MRVLVVGSGAREHSLCVRLKASPSVHHVMCTPGNPGIARDVETFAISASDLDAVVQLCKAQRVDLVVVGPEAPLVAGIADRLAAEGIACFGPSREAAQLEGSKAFSKDFMMRHGIPTARYQRFNDPVAAEKYVRSVGHRVVVKADGIAAGKGVTVCDDTAQALEAIDAIMRKKIFGVAGDCVVIEERLEGQEISFHVVSDGTRYTVLGAAQDHKRLRDGDHGPNTGGMGAYSPVPLCDEVFEARVCREVVDVTLQGLAAENMVFRGVLFVGLMVDAQGNPKVLEYNVRFGDPECAVLLARLDGDVAQWLLGAARGCLPENCVHVGGDQAMGVVIAAEGYPEAPQKGAVIDGIEDARSIPSVRVFHAGTAHNGHHWITAGGRVLLLTATATTLHEAATQVYKAVDTVKIKGSIVRRDIGWRALHTDERWPLGHGTHG
jgi:phosphoribosylamine---glycine ligase